MIGDKYDIFNLETILTVVFIILSGFSTYMAYRTGQIEYNRDIEIIKKQNKPENIINERINHLLSKYSSCSDIKLIIFAEEIKSFLKSSDFKFSQDKYNSLVKLYKNAVIATKKSKLIDKYDTSAGGIHYLPVLLKKLLTDNYPDSEFVQNK